MPPQAGLLLLQVQTTCIALHVLLVLGMDAAGAAWNAAAWLLRVSGPITKIDVSQVGGSSTAPNIPVRVRAIL